MAMWLEWQNDEWEVMFGQIDWKKRMVNHYMYIYTYAQIYIYAMYISNIQIKSYPKLVTQIQTNILQSCLCTNPKNH